MPDVEINYPYKGIHLGLPYSKQPPDTSVSELNVRSLDVIERRARGGQRHGYSRWSDQINGATAVQAMEMVTSQIADATTSSLAWNRSYQGDPSKANSTSMFIKPGSNGNHIYYLDVESANITIVDHSPGGATVFAKEIPGTSGASLLFDLPSMVPGNNNDIFVLCKPSATDAKILNVDRDDPAVVNGSTTLSTFGGATRDVWVNSSNRLVMCASIVGGDSIYVVDWDPVAKTFSLVDKFSLDDLTPSLGDSPVVSCWMPDVNSDVIYAYDQTLVQVHKIQVSTRTIVWSYNIDHTGFDDFKRVRGDNQTPGNLYITHSSVASDGQSILTKIVDNGLSAAKLWSYQTGLANTYARDLKVYDDVVYVLQGDQNNSGNSIALKFNTNGVVLAAESVDVASTATTDYLLIDGYENGDGSTSFYSGYGSNAARPPEYEHIKLDSGEAGITNRQITLVASGGGTLKKLDLTGAASTVTGGSGVLSANDWNVDSATLYTKSYFVDGTNYVVYDALTNIANDWTSLITDGSLPASGSDTARLITVFRRRMVLGLNRSLYFSAASNPLDFNYTPATIVGSSAVSYTPQTPEGVTGIVTGLITYSDDLMIIGQDRQILMLTGDPGPLSNGQFDVVTPNIGMAWRAWTQDAEGNVYFIGSDGQVYAMNVTRDAVGMPVAISEPVNFHLLNLNQAAVRFKLEWEYYTNSLYVYASSVNTNNRPMCYVWEAKSSWHIDVHPNNFGPVSTLLLDGDKESDRVLLLGGKDGYIYKLDRDRHSDEGTPIESHVFYGPIRLTPSNDAQASIRRISATLGIGTSNLQYAVYVGKTAEEAIASTPVFTGSFSGDGRQADIRNRARGTFMYLKIFNTTDNSTWAMEETSMSVNPSGITR